MGETIKLILTVLILALILGIVVFEAIVNIAAFKTIKEFFNGVKEIQNNSDGIGATCGLGGCSYQQCTINGQVVNCSDIGSHYVVIQDGPALMFNEASNEYKCHAGLCQEERENNCTSVKASCISCCMAVRKIVEKQTYVEDS